MGKKLTIYMLDGTPTGSMTVEIGNWSGKAVFSPRGSLKKMLGRPEFDSPGIYFLKSQSNSPDFDDSIYIGEAEELRARLKTHIANRDFESVKSQSLNARMIESDDGFVVLKGSEASKTVSDSIANGWVRIRKKLSDSGKLIEQDDKLIFTDDTTFSSPSAASSVILGRQSAGPISWVDRHSKTINFNSLTRNLCRSAPPV